MIKPFLIDEYIAEPFGVSGKIYVFVYADGFNHWEEAVSSARIKCKDKTLQSSK